VVHCHDLDTLSIGVMLKKKYSIKLIYDAHEIFAYMIERVTNKCVVGGAFILEKILLRYVDHIITVNKPLHTYFSSRSPKPISIVMNCKQLISKEYQPPPSNIFTVIYIGTLHKNRMFPQLIDTIGFLSDIKLILAGQKGSLYELVKQKSSQYPNIEFLGTISTTEVIPKTLKSNAVICMINPTDKNNKLGLANKQFEAMVCARPIITTKGTYAGRLTHKLCCGLVIDYNKSALREAILKLKNNPKMCEEFGKNALGAAINKYNWENEESKLLEVYSSLA
ncbi:MAG: glycosyltransferase, partial [Omnitrophica bacterium]|nr:glycosyltransferase [Candidatus Omnitrophota bacterium]